MTPVALMTPIGAASTGDANASSRATTSMARASAFRGCVAPSRRQPLPFPVDRRRARPRARRPAPAGRRVGRGPPRGRARRSGGGGGTSTRTRHLSGSVAGARGSRTHHATPSAASPVLKTGEPTGTPPLPSAMVARPDAAYHRRVTTTDAPEHVPLTSLTDCGGCAAKLGADLLADALGGLGAAGRCRPT